MDGGVEQPPPPAFQRLPVTRVFFDVRNEPRVEDRFAIVSRIESAIQVEVRAVDFQVREFGHALQRVQSLWEEHRVCFIDWYNGTGANTKPLLSIIARIFSPFWCLWPE